MHGFSGPQKQVSPTSPPIWVLGGQAWIVSNFARIMLTPHRYSGVQRDLFQMTNYFCLPNSVPDINTPLVLVIYWSHSVRIIYWLLMQDIISLLCPQNITQKFRRLSMNISQNPSPVEFGLEQHYRDGIFCAKFMQQPLSPRWSLCSVLNILPKGLILFCTRLSGNLSAYFLA